MKENAKGVNEEIKGNNMNGIKDKVNVDRLLEAENDYNSQRDEHWLQLEAEKTMNKRGGHVASIKSYLK